jgi:predicted nucleic acid-binding protein
MIYLDTSLLVSAFVQDVHSDRVLEWLDGRSGTWTSRWAATEFTSALSLQRRIGRLTDAERDAAEAAFDDWLSRQSLLPVAERHLALARSLVRAGHGLRAADAVHLALAQDHRLILATLDTRLAEAARAAGVEAATP